MLLLPTAKAHASSSTVETRALCSGTLRSKGGKAASKAASKAINSFQTIKQHIKKQVKQHINEQVKQQANAGGGKKKDQKCSK